MKISKNISLGILIGFILLFIINENKNLSSKIDISRINLETHAASIIPKNKDYIIHTTNEYSFEYPSTWFIEDTPSGIKSFISTTITNFNQDFYNKPDINISNENLTRISIIKIPKSDKEKSFRTWLDEYIARGIDDWGSKVLKEENTSVDGYEAIFHIEQLGAIESPVIYINKEDAIYIIIGGSFDKDLDEVFYHLIKSFHFIKI